MKLNHFNRLFPILIIGIFLSLPVLGQEEKGQMEFEPVKESRSESESGESEIKTVIKPASAVLVRDSVANQPKSVKPASKAPEKSQKPEDPLSFNFLYYIIEKFKMSDMIE